MLFDRREKTILRPIDIFCIKPRPFAAWFLNGKRLFDILICSRRENFSRSVFRSIQSTSGDPFSFFFFFFFLFGPQTYLFPFAASFESLHDHPLSLLRAHAHARAYHQVPITVAVTATARRDFNFASTQYNAGRIAVAWLKITGIIRDVHGRHPP